MKKFPAGGGVGKAANCCAKKFPMTPGCIGCGLTSRAICGTCTGAGGGTRGAIVGLAGGVEKASMVWQTRSIQLLYTHPPAKTSAGSYAQYPYLAGVHTSGLC